MSYVPRHNGLPPYPITLTGTVTEGNLITLAGAVAGANSTTCIGVVDRSGVSGDKVGYYPLGFGVQYVVASAAVAVGPIKCAAAGKVAAFVDGTDAQDRRIGMALTAAAADGDVIQARK